MLKEILSPSSCEKCRLCCGFDRDDIWEIPVFSSGQRERLRSSRPELALVPHGKNSFVPDMRFGEDGLAYCPALSEHGCTLGDEKPFDCKIWPFRALEKDGKTVLALSPVCETVAKVSEEKIAGLAEKLVPAVRDEIRENPDIVKPFIEGYRVFAKI